MDESVISLYKGELEWGRKKQKIFDSLPAVNRDLYMKGLIEIESVRNIDDKILEIRSARLKEELKLFPYKAGLDIQ